MHFPNNVNTDMQTSDSKIKKKKKKKTAVDEHTLLGVALLAVWTTTWLIATLLFRLVHLTDHRRGHERW